MRIRFAFAAVLGLASCDMIVVSALNLVTTTEFSVQGDALLMSGEINSKTPEQFEAIIAENPNINTLIEVDVPG
ncbi:MAG: hypothetical protein P8Q23_07630, partial [Paracoccaceae bacterium]|nr:hypothetical protein [Paracoccaceae bacterium]